MSRSQAEFMGRIRCLDCKNFVEHYFLYSASPVLRGVKPSVLVTIGQEHRQMWEKAGGRLCRRSGLKSEILYSRQGSFSVLIYSERALLEALSDKKAQELLYKSGYGGEDLDSLFSYLKYRCHRQAFPHEIGVFLGYPPEDVESFIFHKGRNYSLCRYWKVYHNEKKAIETFRRIDEAKIRAIDLLSGSVPMGRAIEAMMSN